MIQSGFLGKEDRGELIALARDGSAACRVTLGANALVLLDDGWAFFRDHDAIRGWRKHSNTAGSRASLSAGSRGAPALLSGTGRGEPCANAAGHVLREDAAPDSG